MKIIKVYGLYIHEYIDIYGLSLSEFTTKKLKKKSFNTPRKIYDQNIM